MRTNTSVHAGVLVSDPARHKGKTFLFSFLNVTLEWKAHSNELLYGADPTYRITIRDMTLCQRNDTGGIIIVLTGWDGDRTRGC